MKDFDVVMVIEDIYENGILIAESGFKGTIVNSYSDGNFEVEFVIGDTSKVVTLSKDKILNLW